MRFQRRRHQIVIAFALAFSACAGEPPHIEQSRLRAPSPSVAIDSGTADVLVVDAGVTLDTDTPTPSRDVIDPVAWLVAHGVANAIATSTISTEGYGHCHELDVGAPPQVSLDCQENERVTQGTGVTAAYRDVVHEKIRVVSAGKPRVVADMAIGIFSPDFPDNVVLDLNLSTESSTTLRLVDALPPHVSCAAAIANVDHPKQKQDPLSPNIEPSSSQPQRNQDPLSRNLDALDRTLIARICRGRGRYVWSVNRFVGAL
jgi:hypothetical protein